MTQESHSISQLTPLLYIAWWHHHSEDMAFKNWQPYKLKTLYHTSAHGQVSGYTYLIEEVWSPSGLHCTCPTEDAITPLTTGALDCRDGGDILTCTVQSDASTLVTTDLGKMDVAPPASGEAED